MCDMQRRSILTSWGPIRITICSDVVTTCELPVLDTIPKEAFAVLDAGTDRFSCFVHELLEGVSPVSPPVRPQAGTAFQSMVWKGLQSIPRGETCSYRELAEKIGHARSCRAVANACGRNPAPLFIPCHRVIRSDGNAGGFSCGLPWKELLLGLEQASALN
jgi:O-6-methylguanine DNA methyltransferase